MGIPLKWESPLQVLTEISVFCLHRCPFSKVSASSRYLLPPLPPGPPAAAAASPRLPAGPPRAVAAGPQRPHGPGPPAQWHAAPVADPAAHPAVPGRHRSLLPTSGTAPAIPAAAAAPGSSAPQARLASQVGRGGAEEGTGRGRDGRGFFQPRLAAVTKCVLQGMAFASGSGIHLGQTLHNSSHHPDSGSGVG